MKRLWMLVMLLSLAMGAKANHEEATVVIRSENGRPLIVELNNWRSAPATVVRLDHLRPGHHTVRIFRLRSGSGYYGHQQELVFAGTVQARAGYKTVYSLHHGCLELVRRQLVYAQQGYGGYGPQYGSGVCGIHNVGNCGCPGYPTHPGHGYGYGNGHGYYGYGSGSGPSCGPGYCNGSCGGTCGYTSGYGSGYYGPPGTGPGWTGTYPGGYRIISPSEFESIMDRSRTYFMGSDKVDFFQRETEGRSVNQQQIRAMASTLVFESDKYELLTSLYERSTEPERYKELSSEFTFLNTRREFEEYLRQQTER